MNSNLERFLLAIILSLLIILPLNAEIPEKYQNKISSTLPKCSGEDYYKILNLMWNETEAFQEKFHRKKSDEEL